MKVKVKGKKKNPLRAVDINKEKGTCTLKGAFFGGLI